MKEQTSSINVDLLLQQIREQATFQTPIAKHFGVITAADASFYPGLQILVASIRVGIPICVFDLGLTDKQRDWLRANGASIEKTAMMMGPQISGWQMWNKVLYWKHSPFVFTLWIDADCVVTGSLDPLFTRIEKAPFVVRHPFGANYCRRNDAELRSLFPVVAPIPDDQPLNSGVFGFAGHRDRQILDKCEELTRAAAADEIVRRLITFYDEGVLHWALEALGRPEVIVDEPRWNEFFSSDSSDPQDFVNLIHQISSTGGVIAHFTGRPKPWEKWTNLGDQGIC
ncbi:MAG TPA: glycosyltransferase [Pirellula sp.]|nr:glycosyltransferase [Pirellula sp.]